MFIKNSQFNNKPTMLTLTNKNGTTVKIMNYGASIANIFVPDKNGELGDVVLGYDTFDEFKNGNSSQGAVVGRFANRIAKGKFTLNGKEYKLYKNDGENTLHGGLEGFHKKLWAVDEIADTEEPYVILSYESPNGEEGFPGNLTVKVKYTLTSKDELVLDYSAVCDEDTILNLTNHVYFNLKGKGRILSHLLKLNADFITETTPDLIPTGRIVPVKNTPYDFTKERPIGTDINSGLLPKGYDKNFVLGEAGTLRTAAILTEKETGRRLVVETDMPGLQVYTSNGLSEIGKSRLRMDKFSGICLETQQFPDAINHENFPSPIIKANKEYTYKTIYRFEVQDDNQ